MRVRQLVTVKPIAALLAAGEGAGGRLERRLGPLQLTALGVGAIIGAGIFSTVGAAAAGGPGHPGAGPALALSFLLTAGTCGLAALCYAEFAAMVPIAGSAYTYAYATLGELVAWVIGWDLIIEYAVGNVAVAISWSAYFQELLRGVGLAWPSWLGTDLRTAQQAAAHLGTSSAAGLPPATLAAATAWLEAPRIGGVPLLFNVPAAGVVLAVTWVLVRGIRESAGLNLAMVVLKMAVIAFFLAVGTAYVRPEHWLPFAPNGMTGIGSAAAIIFFAYIGFDAVSTAAEETRDPQRNMPVGIIASLLVCTIIYVAVSVVLTGLVPYAELNTPEPLADAFARLHMTWTAGIVSAGAVFATTSVLVVFQLGQPRIFLAMARDGLLPPWAARIHPRYHTPHTTTILTGLVVALFAGLANLDEVVELTNIGTLFAFILVAVGVIVLRRADPARHRPFRTPLVPWVPLAAVASCGYLMAQLPALTWIRFVSWLLLGLVVYASYGYRHSRLRTATGEGGAPEP